MITIQKYIKETNSKGKATSHGFEFIFTDSKGTTQSGALTFSNRKYEEERKADTTSVLKYFEKVAKETYPIASDKINNVVEFKTPAEIKTELGDSIIEV